METVILISLTIIGGLISLAQYSEFKEDCSDSVCRLRYLFLTSSLAVCAALASVMVLCYGTRACFFLYAADKFFKVLIMVEIVMLTKSLVDEKSKYISYFITIIGYGAVLLFFVDSMMSAGVLDKSICGIYLAPENPLHMALYFIYYMAYVIMLTTLAVFKGVSVVKKRERHELVLLGIIYVCSAGGFLGEIFLIANRVTYVPLALILNLVAIVFIRKLLVYHDSIRIDEEKFSDCLDPGRTDISLVLDDRMKVLYQNKRAQVIACLTNDNFIDRKISEIFDFSEEDYKRINSKPDEMPFGVGADYVPGNRHVNMIIQHKLDLFGEILYTTVFVYNMEDTESMSSKAGIEDEGNENESIQNVLSLTKGARVLIVDEDVLFLNVFGRVLTQYGVEVSRATDGLEAVNKVKNNVYDIIFVTYEMKSINGNEIVRRIRSFSGQYFSQVPIVFVTESDINEVFHDFIDAGFNDYLIKPVSKVALSAVLSRWLWQRFGKESTGDAKAVCTIKAQIMELSKLIEDAEYMFNKGKTEMFLRVIRGMKRTCDILEFADIAELCADIKEAVILDDDIKTIELFARLKSVVRDAIAING